jgi:hypothetical protein
MLSPFVQYGSPFSTGFPSVLMQSFGNQLLYSDNGNPLAPDVGSAMTLARNTVGACWVYAYSDGTLSLATIPADQIRNHGGIWNSSDNTWHTTLQSGASVSSAAIAGMLPGVMLETGQTNLLVYSQDFDNAAWTKGNVTVTANSIAAPDGTTTADLLLETTANDIHYVQKSITESASTTYVRSVYAKAGARHWLAIQSKSLDNKFHFANFDLSSGVLGTVSLATASCVDVGSGFFLCSMVWSSGTGATGANDAFFLENADNSQSYTGVITSGLYLWGAQQEASAHATSYIPTSGSTAARSADVFSGATANVIHADSGKLQVKFCPSWTGGPQYLWGSYTDADNWTRLYYDGSNFIFEARIAATTYQATYAVAISAGTQYIVTGLWTSAALRVQVNGAEGTAVVIPSQIILASTHQIGADGNGGNQHGGTHQGLQIWR